MCGMALPNKIGQSCRLCVLERRPSLSADGQTMLTRCGGWG